MKTWSLLLQNFWEMETQTVWFGYILTKLENIWSFGIIVATRKLSY